MQDFKHLTGKKQAARQGIAGSFSRKNKLRQPGQFQRLKLKLPTGKTLQRLKLGLLFIALVLALAPVSYLLVRKASPILADLGKWAATVTKSTPAPAEAARQPVSQTNFETASDLLANADLSAPRITAKSAEGQQFYYTIDGNLQRRVYDYMARYKVPYGVFVAIEPSSGKILGMTSYSSADPDWTKRSAYQVYPMASLFKIITATAALENNKITPDSVVEFRGRAYSENPRYWDVNPRGKNSQMDVTYAMGKSINPLYGRLASDYAGKTSIMESVHRYGFNQKLLPDTPAKVSEAVEPATISELRLMGAGLDRDVKISPIHAAVIMSAIANNGVMMAPGLTSSVLDHRGFEREVFTPRQIRRLVAPETSASLSRILSTTVLNGTSRKAFHDRRGRPLVNVEIAAKTGSINGTDPKGHYSWFAAYAPISDPQIALVALVINPGKWKLKASQVGEQALEEFFKK